MKCKTKLLFLLLAVLFVPFAGACRVTLYSNTQTTQTESPTESQAETRMEAPTEKPTAPPTEPPTAPPTEKPTEPTTEDLLYFSESYPDSDTLAKTIFDPAIALYRNFEGIGDVGFAGYSSEYFYLDDYPDYFIEQPGNRYYMPVKDERYPTYQAFVDELRKHFSEQLTKELLSGGTYIERDGKFYLEDGARGMNVDFYDASYEVTSQVPGKVVFTATARYIRDDRFSWDLPEVPGEMLESRDFVYNYELEGGKWVFTNFQLFY